MAEPPRMTAPVERTDAGIDTGALGVAAAGESVLSRLAFILLGVVAVTPCADTLADFPLG